jgi:hypothetical protein
VLSSNTHAPKREARHHQQLADKCVNLIENVRVWAAEVGFTGVVPELEVYEFKFKWWGSDGN